METNTSQLPQIIQTILKLRPATADDFKRIEYLNTLDGVIQKTVPNTGQSYWLLSPQTQKVDNQCYQIDDNTDWDEFRSWLLTGMVYVTISGAWMKEQEAKEAKRLEGIKLENA